MSPIVRYTRADHGVITRAPARDAPAPDAAGAAPGEAGWTTPAPRSPRPDRELMTAWLLLLLGRRATHGYALRRQLVARGLDVDPAALYRALRKLEDDGCIASRWMEPAGGPRRRLYRLTASGRRRLHDAAGLITAIRDVHDAFLRDHATWGADVTVDR